MHPENRPYLHALYVAILANAHLQRHQNAVILIDKILAYNPADNQGARWLLGPELLRVGDYERALSVLKLHAGEFSPYWYELSLLHFIKGEPVKAATAFRHCFATNTYIAEICIHFRLPRGIISQAVRTAPGIIMQHTARYGVNIRKCCGSSTGSTSIPLF